MAIRVRARKWRVVVSLLLALLFLYNPYQSFALSSGGLGVSHRASYRATVGSSELQHFASTERRTMEDVGDHVIFELFVFFSTPTGTFSPRPAEHPPSVPQVLSASLWFRPPPAR